MYDLLWVILCLSRSWQLPGLLCFIRAQHPVPAV
jgi:hypothetical protein